MQTKCKLSASRAKDRVEMADQFFSAMMAAGAVSIDRETRKDYAPRRIRFRVEARGGAYLHFQIDGDSPDIFGGTWTTDGPIFLDPALGDVNPFHFGKLNRYYRHFEDAVMAIARDLERFAAGEGYLPHSDPRIVAMCDRYRANGWRWFSEAS